MALPGFLMKLPTGCSCNPTR